MTKLERVVRRNESVVGRKVIDTAGGELLDSPHTKNIAAPQAVNHLGSASLGEQFRDYLGDDRMEVDRFVPSATEPSLPPPPTLVAVAEGVRNEGKMIDQGLDIGTKILAAASFLGVPWIATIISPEVQEAAGDRWWAVLLATFTWTAGCTLSVIVWNRSGLVGLQQISATAICFAIALGIAGALGTGVLDVGAGFVKPGIPPMTVLAFVESAIRAYGVGGALLGFGLGVWLGSRLSPRVPENFLADW